MSDGTEDEPLRVALLGCGVVGSAVARLLTEHGDDLAARVPFPVRLSYDFADVLVERGRRNAERGTKVEELGHGARSVVPRSAFRVPRPGVGEGP